MARCWRSSRRVRTRWTTRPAATDVANSTQYIFLYNVAGANKTQPVLQQVIKQTNAWVGLVFSTDGNTIYGTGGADDSVYYYVRRPAPYFRPRRRNIALGHGSHNRTPPWPRSAAWSRMRAGSAFRPMAATLVGDQQLQRLDQRDRHGDQGCPVSSTTCGHTPTGNEGSQRGGGRHVSVSPS